MRVAIVGLGWWGRVLFDAALACGDRFTVRLGATVKPDEARLIRDRYGIPVVGSLDEVLADPSIEAVILATPPSQHRAQIEAIAAAGKHIFTEKPFTLTRADAVAAIASCRAAGVHLAVGFNRRFLPPMPALKRLVADGSLGTILHAEANFSHDELRFYDPTGWRFTDADSPGLAIGASGAGMHALDALVWLCGPIAKVRADAAHRAIDLPGSTVKVRDVLNAGVVFASGATGTLTTLLGTPLTWRIAVYGTNGRAETDGLYTLVHQPSGGPAQRTSWPPAPAEPVELAAFADLVVDGKPYLVEDREVIDVVAAFEAMAEDLRASVPA